MKPWEGATYMMYIHVGQTATWEIQVYMMYTCITHIQVVVGEQ